MSDIRVGDDLFGVYEASRGYEIVLCTVTHATAKVLHVNRCSASGHAATVDRDLVNTGHTSRRFAPALFTTRRAALEHFRDQELEQSKRHDRNANWAQAELEQIP